MGSQWKLVPVEPTETMVINGFESEPDECFTDEEVWEQYQGMSGCQQAAFRAKLCWAAMLAAAPAPPQGDTQTVGEREEFTNWVRREWPQAPLNYVRDLLPEDDPRYGEYCDERIQRAWVSWQARAALSRPDAAEVARLTAERNALQQRLNAADQRIDELTRGDGEQIALMPVERSYEVRSRQIIAFNTSKQAGEDLDDNLGAAYKAALRFTPSPDASAFLDRDDSIAWLKRIDGIGQNRAELIYSMGFRRRAD